jgi:hypothetical protein
MNEDEYQKWVDSSRRRASQRKDREMQSIPCIRVSNDRYAKDAAFEDRLSMEDRQLLRDMGILL